MREKLKDLFFFKEKVSGERHLETTEQDIAKEVPKESPAEKAAFADYRKTKRQLFKKAKVPREGHLKTVEEMDAQESTEQDIPKKSPKGVSE